MFVIKDLIHSKTRKEGGGLKERNKTNKILFISPFRLFLASREEFVTGSKKLGIGPGTKDSNIEKNQFFCF